MDKHTKIFVAGHRGMVGSAIVRTLAKRGFTHILVRSRSEVDLLNAGAVRAFFQEQSPEVVVLAAARVGGIVANASQPVEFLIENLTIQNNTIQAAADFGVQKLLFLGSSCIYPKLSPQPIPESALLTGALEPSNDAYALAKIAGIRLCQAYASQYGKNFISAMPTNLYGPNDNFDLRTSHVLPALLRKIHEAKMGNLDQVSVWGTGTPRREFLHVDDLADACVFLLENYDSSEIINIGCGQDTSIRDLAVLICEILGFQGDLVFDPSMPDGTPRKLLDMQRLFGMGWRPQIPLREGIAHAYKSFLEKFA